MRGFPYTCLAILDLETYETIGAMSSRMTLEHKIVAHVGGDPSGVHRLLHKALDAMLKGYTKPATNFGPKK